MKITAYIMIGFWFFACTQKKEKYGNLVIAETQPIYEDDYSYFSHDYFVEVDLQQWLDTMLTINKENNHLKIINKYHNGFFGHKIEFTISKALEITNVEYDWWSDVVNDSKPKYKVEKVIFSVNANPFESTQIVGYYTMQIRTEYLDEDMVKTEGTNNVVAFNIFNGKFKVYSEQEKEKGINWVINKNEILMGIKDSLNVYYRPDTFAEFKFGVDSLLQIVRQIEIKPSKTKQEERAFVLLQMIIDENGKVIFDNMTIRESITSDEFFNKLKDCESLMSNWQPAFYKNKPVKSYVNIPIRIND